MKNITVFLNAVSWRKCQTVSTPLLEQSKVCRPHKKSWQTVDRKEGEQVLSSLETTSGPRREPCSCWFSPGGAQQDCYCSGFDGGWQDPEHLVFFPVSNLPAPQHTGTHAQMHTPPPRPQWNWLPCSVPTRFAQWGEPGLSELGKGLGFGVSGV